MQERQNRLDSYNDQVKAVSKKMTGLFQSSLAKQAAEHKKREGARDLAKKNKRKAKG